MIILLLGGSGMRGTRWKEGESRFFHFILHYPSNFSFLSYSNDKGGLAPGRSEY